MSLLMVLGIWIVASVAITPLVGYFLSDGAQRAAERRARKELETGLNHSVQPPL